MRIVESAGWCFLVTLSMLPGCSEVEAPDTALSNELDGDVDTEQFQPESNDTSQEESLETNTSGSIDSRGSDTSERTAGEQTDAGTVSTPSNDGGRATSSFVEDASMTTYANVDGGELIPDAAGSSAGAPKHGLVEVRQTEVGSLFYVTSSGHFVEQAVAEFEDCQVETEGRCLHAICPANDGGISTSPGSYVGALTLDGLDTELPLEWDADLDQYLSVTAHSAPIWTGGETLRLQVPEDVIPGLEQQLSVPSFIDLLPLPQFGTSTVAGDYVIEWPPIDAGTVRITFSNEDDTRVVRCETDVSVGTLVVESALIEHVLSERREAFLSIENYSVVSSRVGDWDIALRAVQALATDTVEFEP